MSKEITRRRFLVLGGGAGLSAVLGGAYVVSACPLSDSGVCVGPCTAYIDRLGDGICDRAYADRARAQAVAQASGSEGTEAAEGTVLARCPLGLINDPYPGECQHYVDEDGDGFCDLSQGQAATDGDVGQASRLDNSVGQASQPDDDVGQAGQPDPDTGQTSQSDTVTVACPFGIVNDPYPGKCRRYVDRDGDGICDLSVPQEGGQASQPDDQITGQASEAPTLVPSTPQPQVGVACPFGLVNDPYPGQCRRYVDQDGDGICDLSEPGSGLNVPEDAPQVEEEGSRRRRGRGSGRR
jgi:hypothetical protein